MQRQSAPLDSVIIADASAVLDDHAIQWLIENPGTVLASGNGRPLAVAIDHGSEETGLAAFSGNDCELPVRTPTAIGERYIRKLRRKSEPLAISLEELPPGQAERLLFASVYKGITDLVTKWVWPVPALFATRLAARLGVRPNLVTLLGLALTAIAGWLFFVGNIVGGLAAAWAMTFLDTVDGKLARVTVTSSKVGNWLDHGNDIIHPPLWWACLAHGLVLNDPGSSLKIWTALGVILACYVLGRAIEISFHLLFGFNGFLFRRFDGWFRLVVARRNVLLLIMTVAGATVGWTEAFFLCAAWSLTSVSIQAVRLAQASLAARKQALKPCLA